jgi:uncharacterized membrane protein YbhN (UPF0104 family)
VGGAITLGFLALALRNVRLNELWLVLREAKLVWILALAGVSCADLAIRSARWKLLLSRSAPRAPVFLLLRLEAIGLAMNNVLFMRLGELARGVLAARELAIPVATALASVAVERALDVAALLTLFCAAGFGLPALVDPSFLHLAALALLAALAAIGVLAFAEERLAPGHRWERLLRPWPVVHRLVVQLAAGASVLREAVPALKVAGLSLLLWAVDGWAYWAGARALGLDALVDYPRSILILSWAGAAAAIPTAPGGFGSFELAVQTLVKKMGASDQQALAYALFNHMVGYIVITLIGIVFLWQIGLSLGELRAVLEKEKAR